MKNTGWPTHNMWDADFSVPQKGLKLYRFMNFNKFKSLLKGKLFFTRASFLSDEFEGEYFAPELAKEFMKNKNNTFVSCWTVNDPRIESSMLLWELYSRERHSIQKNLVAIGISIEKFFSGLFQDEIFEKYIGKINYLNSDNVVYPGKYKVNSLVPFFLKRNCFIDENEIRIVIQDMDSEGLLSFKVDDNLKGIFVPIDLENIDEIIVSPKSESDFYDEVKSLIREHQLEITIERVSVPSIINAPKINEKVEYIIKHNNRPFDIVNNYSNEFALEIAPISYGTMERDASGNYYFVNEISTLNNSNRFSSRKSFVARSVQKSQCGKKVQF